MNSFGFGGSNTHVVLDDAFHYLQERELLGNHCVTSISDEPNTGAAVSQALISPKLLVWSAADEKAAERTAKNYESYYANKISGNHAKLNQLAFTLAARRSHSKFHSGSISYKEPITKS